MQPSRIHHVGLPVSDLDISVAWYREALGLTHEAVAGVPGGVAFMVAPTGERLELLAVDPQNSAWDDPILALRAGVGHTAWIVDDLDAAHTRAVGDGRPLGLDASRHARARTEGSRSSLTRTGISWSCFPATGKLHRPELARCGCGSVGLNRRTQ
jgi:catechol 2,3-dioxygenase-like lactoylglutathione lyase family enzyme